MQRDTSVTVTRDIQRDRAVTLAVTFGVSHGAPSRPAPSLLTYVLTDTPVSAPQVLGQVGLSTQVGRRARAARHAEVVGR